MFESKGGSERCSAYGLEESVGRMERMRMLNDMQCAQISHIKDLQVVCLPLMVGYDSLHFAAQAHLRTLHGHSLSGEHNLRLHCHQSPC